MEEKIRKTGIDLIGDVPWGTHFCQFYQTKEDLIDILAPYFKAGLENNEFCMWITSEPLSEKEAKKAMRKAVPNLDRYLKKGQIEIVSHTEWYLKDGAFNLQRVLDTWIDKLNQALAKGFNGIRVTGNAAQLDKRDWRDFADYEEEVNNVIGKYRMMAICTYCLDKCGAIELIDVVRSHQCALIRREDEWELIESSERQRLERENRRLREELSRKVQFANIIGKSDRMKSVFEMIRIVAQSDCTVLIRGESGTGKELVARTIHYSGPRRDKPFVAVNCAAIPEALLESELFGYEKGAFTDATRGKPGKFELASGGTIFLDEIADMSLAMQAKMLRVLQEHTFERLGGIRSLTANVRLISATNKNLEELIQAGSFREDLYYRLNVVCLQLPSLREKKEDIPLLVDHFLEKFNQLNHKKIKKVSSLAVDLLINYDWPGNIRELENVIERAVVLATGNTIFPGHLPSHLHEKKKSMLTLSFTDLSLKQTEKELIEKILQATGWNQSKAAKKLGIHRNTLRSKIKKFGISRP